MKKTERGLKAAKAATSKPTKAAGAKAASVRKTGKHKSESEIFEELLRTRGMSSDSLKSHRFAGVSLGGGKTDKTAVAVIEYYPEGKRVFLRTLRDKIGSIEKGHETSLDGDGPETADAQLLAQLTSDDHQLTSIAFDAPLQMPKCIRCELKCPGFESCKLPEIRWMWQMHRKRDRTKRPNKMFTPYTERSAEIYIAHELEEPFHPSHALGSNAAPLTARAHYLRRRLHVPVIEAYPKLTLWRVGLALNIPKSYLRFHRHAVDSDEARLYILKTLIEKEIAFIYQQDLKVMVENSQAFDAFMGALTAFLKFRGQTEKPPLDFPKHESWIEFPKQNIQWF